MLCLLTTTIRDSLTKCSNYAEENPAILSKNYGNGSSKQEQQQEMEGVSGESYRNAQRKIEGGVAAAAAFKLQSTGFDTLGQAKNIYLIRDDVKSHDILPGSCSKTTETRRTTPTTTRQKGAIWAITICHHFIHKKNYCTFSIFFIPTVSRHEGTNFSLD